jgi:hypothetical protein
MGYIGGKVSFFIYLSNCYNFNDYNLFFIFFISNAEDSYSSQFRWEFTGHQKNVLDSIANCIIVPFGHSSEWSVRNPFSRSDQLQTMSKIKIGTLLTEVIFLFCGEPGFDPTFQSFFLLQGTVM